jgi:hypothetical protein
VCLAMSPAPCESLRSRRGHSWHVFRSLFPEMLKWEECPGVLASPIHPIPHEESLRMNNKERKEKLQGDRALGHLGHTRTPTAGECENGKSVLVCPRTQMVFFKLFSEIIAIHSQQIFRRIISLLEVNPDVAPRSAVFWPPSGSRNPPERPKHLPPKLSL